MSDGRIAWPPSPRVVVRDGMPYVAGTDFPIAEVRGYDVPGVVETAEWLEEGYPELDRYDLLTAVSYFKAHYFLFLEAEYEREGTA